MLIFAACSEKELTHEEKLRQVVDIYIDDMLKNEPITEYSIDSLEINNITQKQILKKEALEYKAKTMEAMEKAKALGKKYQSTQSLVGIIEEHEGQGSTSNLGRTSMQEMKEEAELLMKEAKEMGELAKEKAQQWEIADSTSIVHYEVIARGSITSSKNVKKPATFPFHISKDYKILKEPMDLLKMPR